MTLVLSPRLVDKRRTIQTTTRVKLGSISLLQLDVIDQHTSVLIDYDSRVVLQDCRTVKEGFSFPTLSLLGYVIDKYMPLSKIT